jgi:hypothetical protein
VSTADDLSRPSPDASPRVSISHIEMALIAALIVAWVPGILQLAEVWNSLEYASHGFLVPFVALWAATAHREELGRLGSRPVSGGLVLMGGVAGCYLVALVLRNPTLLGLVAVGTVVASVLALRGVAWVKTLRFSLGYLLFMVFNDLQQGGINRQYGYVHDNTRLYHRFLRLLLHIFPQSI